MITRRLCYVPEEAESVGGMWKEYLLRGQGGGEDKGREKRDESFLFQENSSMQSNVTFQRCLLDFF